MVDTGIVSPEDGLVLVCYPDSCYLPRLTVFGPQLPTEQVERQEDEFLHKKSLQFLKQ